MFKIFHVWLQITLGNQMPEKSEFPLKPHFVGMWIPFKTSGYPHSKLKENCIFYKLTILTFFSLSFKQ